MLNCVRRGILSFSLIALTILTVAVSFLFKKENSFVFTSEESFKSDETVTIAIHGLASGWQAGEPLISLSFRHHIISPLVRAHQTVRVIFCLDQPLQNGDLRVVEEEGAERVEQYIYDSTKWRRRGECYNRALEILGVSDWWVAIRSDLIFYRNIPSFYNLDKNVIHSRARMARWEAATLIADHFSIPYGTDCVDHCPTPCLLFTRSFVMSDDAFAIVPSAMAPAYFIEDIDKSIALPGSKGSGCEGIVHSSFATLLPHLADVPSFPEMVFTCQVMLRGGKFAPLAVTARFNPYNRNKNDWWGVLSSNWGVGGSMAWPQSDGESRNCSGAFDGPL